MARQITGLSSSISKPSKMFVHWFRHGDLRLHDNPALCQSIANVKDSSTKDNGLVPIFCFDPRYFGQDARSEFNSMKCGPRRAQFILESVQDLRANLEKRGSGLIVLASTKAEDIFECLHKTQGDPSLGEKNNGLHITCQEEVASEEKRINKSIQALNNKYGPLSLESVWGSTLYNPEDLPFYDGLNGIPDTFTPFRNKVEKNCDINAPLGNPTKADLKLPSEAIMDTIIKCLQNYTNNESPLSYMPTLLDLGYTQEDIDSMENQKSTNLNFKGGETAALARVEDYIWDKDLLKTYFDTRNGKKEQKN